ncbi:peptidoglycan-binding protein [Texcoconibacillus texcoconensis]|uniref:Peptidoglycan hydrolase-like protein with peptidoglycan-binding domain n=1 Tax=Texcoconibacillus texcoconensis TaxID=1095777 RepID=A0A840QUT1_9BACI|nr:peptidoglycan-binding protein [Texcoconibacillus texcoconensis]MBB5175039.1 peptidoglycan hydrolase-like protein with peptidoglycan-binding domain [Texcoconibacillus texcoconensis]
MILRHGDRGKNVEQLQEDLLTLGENLPNYGADGHFGDETEAAVRSFQSRHNLHVDGVVGPETFGQIERLLAADEELYRVQVGAFSTRENAETIEEQLKNDGYDTYIVKG